MKERKGAVFFLETPCSYSPVVTIIARAAHYLQGEHN